MQTPFNSGVHGYRFRNSFDGMYPALCGGMSFSSLDYYYSGVEIPQVGEAPIPGDELYEYLLRRQLEAHAFAIPTLIAGRNQWGTNSRDTSTSTAFAALKRWCDLGSPLPILLGDLEDPLSTDSHWVVALGYREGPGGSCAQIDIYDNNYPGQNCWLRPNDLIDPGRPCFEHSRTHRERRAPHRLVPLYGFYVPFFDYRPLDPRRHHDPSWAMPGTAVEPGAL